MHAMGAAAVAYQEYSVRVIWRGLGSLGSGPSKEESQQLENVLSVCGVLQSVDDHRRRRVCGKASRKDAVILLVFTGKKRQVCIIMG